MRPSSHRSVQLTISLPIGYGPTPTEQLEAAIAADKLGLGGVAVGELNSTDAMALIGAMAVATSQIRLETSVTAVWSRSAALYAMGAATLSDLSDGRFVLGLGAGSPIVAGFHGSEFTAPLRHVRMMVQDVRAALGGETLRHAGGFRLRGIPAADVPLVVSAMNDRMVALAGEVADGIILNFCDPAEAARLGRLARDARPDDGSARRPFEIHAVVWLYVGADEARGRATFRHELAPYLGVPTYQRAAVALSDEDAVMRTADVWRQSGREAAAAVFPESIVDALLLVGSPDRIAARVEEFRAAGCDGVRFTPIGDRPGDGQATQDAVEILHEAQLILDDARARDGRSPGQ
jgi:alkanesulfonate monooxygenase SsuD/methylene tetrahydromethanopterin reductase-like flavin-dependent oxidoreductase (luciferase family)